VIEGDLLGLWSFDLEHSNDFAVSPLRSLR
jgi:hypothetical protein